MISTSLFHINLSSSGRSCKIEAIRILNFWVPDVQIFLTDFWTIYFWQNFWKCFWQTFWNIFWHTFWKKNYKNFNIFLKDFWTDFWHMNFLKEFLNRYFDRFMTTFSPKPLLYNTRILMENFFWHIFSTKIVDGPTNYTKI